MSRTRVATKVFPGPQNIGLFAAEALGFFEQRGLDVDIAITSGSDEQRKSLRDGTTQIMHSAVDNAIHMAVVDHTDVVIVAGGGTGMNDLIVRPEIGSYQEIRGKCVVVDAADTAYAFLLYTILAKHGLERGSYRVLPRGGAPQRLAAMNESSDHVAAMLNPPCSLQAQAQGYHSFGSASSAVGPYQGDGVFAMRSWARSNAEALVRYLSALVLGTRWALAPENLEGAIGILGQRLRLDPTIARLALETSLNSGDGLAHDARFDPVGFQQTLAIRNACVGFPGGRPPSAAGFLDMTYYDKAVANLST